MKKLFAAFCLGVALCAQLAAFPKNVPDALKTAQWIWPYPYLNFDIANSYALFRTPVVLDAAPKKAMAYISADQNYMLYVNGELVARGPARGFQRSQPFDAVDVSKYLKKGKNLFAVRAYCVGRSTFAYVSEGVAGAIFAYDIDGKVYASSPSTKCLRQTSCDRDTAPMSMQLNNQEHIDMRLEPVGWTDFDFDDSKWGRSEGGRPYNYMPYFELEERAIPMLNLKMLPAPKVVACGGGKSGWDCERIRNVFELLDLEKSKVSATSQNMPVVVKANKVGEFSEFVVEYPRMVVGSLVLEVEGAKGGEIVDILTDEAVDADFKLVHDPKEHCKPQIGARLICRKGSFKHEFFQIMGFKSAVVRVRNNSADFKLNLLVRWSAYPLEEKGKLRTSDTLVNRIWEASVHTQRICTLDAYVDTPWREQAQWWGDARVHGWNTFFIANDPRVLARGIHIIGSQVAPDGLTYGHAPTMAHHCILPDFSLVWILTIWDYYWQTGDIGLFAENKAVADGIVKYYQSRLSPRGLPTYDPLHWLFLDWTNLPKDGEPSLLALLYLETLDKMTEMAKLSNMPSEAARYAGYAKSLRAAIGKHLLRPDGLVCDGILSNGKVSTKTSIHSQIWAKTANLEGLDFAKAKRELILPYLRGEKTPEAEPSPYWAVYMFKQMIDDGNQKEVFDFIKKRWAVMADFGSTWEKYSDKASHSHAWSAHPSFLLPQILSGIKQTAAGWRDFTVNPNYFVDEAEIVWPTPRGNITVSWKKNPDGTYTTTRTLPQN